MTANRRKGARVPSGSSFSRIGVVGAGLMGSGIAESASRAGIEVLVYEPDAGPLQASQSRIAGSLERAVRGGKASAQEVEEALHKLSWTSEIDDLRDCDPVIEAVYEDPALKGKLFRALDRVLEPATLLASNTSSIPIAQIASWTRHPQRVLGLHFFSPVPVMKLVEIVVGLDSDPRFVQRAQSFAAAIGKTPILTKDRSGFIVNMLLVPYLMAAVRMYEEGFASREDIDDGMKLGAGHPMGPLTLCDMIGLDVLYAVCDSLYEEFKRSEYAPPPLLKRMVVSGHHGRKSARGFYQYGESAVAAGGAAIAAASR
jgi:3-hydroxybutyryl-CoA dehydrogenase